MSVRTRETVCREGKLHGVKTTSVNLTLSEEMHVEGQLLKQCF